VKSDSLEHTSNHQAEIRLRVVAPEDEAFLYEVYRSVRSEEMLAWGWDATQQELFLKMQLKARDQSYLMYYPGLDNQIILFRNQPAGRLIVSRTDEDIRLIDIALLPEYRNARIGTSLIEDLCAEADATNRPVRLQVEKTNPPALRLYERLGFSVTSENQTHFQMEWKSRDEG
jgi:ribosomal protein S18 acetylase RimI-like enzyme